MLARALPSGLTNLSLNFKGCESIIDEGLEVLARALPSGLTNFSLNFKAGKRIIATDLKDLFRALPSGLISITAAAASATAPTAAPSGFGITAESKDAPHQAPHRLQHEALSSPAPSAAVHVAAAAEEYPPVQKRRRVGAQDAAAAVYLVFPGPPAGMPADADERMLAFGETTGPTAIMSGPAAAGDSGMNAVHADVFASRAVKIKQFQRDYPDVRKRWFEHCGMHFDGVKVPYRHDDASIFTQFPMETSKGAIRRTPTVSFLTIVMAVEAACGSDDRLQISSPRVSIFVRRLLKPRSMPATLSDGAFLSI